MKRITINIIFIFFIIKVNWAETTLYNNKVNADQIKKFKDFKTQLQIRSVDLNYIIDTGAKKNVGPALVNPLFTTQLLDINYNDKIQGVFVDINGEQRFYPYNILVRHYIINDVIQGHYILITYCPLCSASIVYNRNVGGRILEFYASGKVYESNLVMYDDLSESLWSQAKGEAIVGSYAGQKLEVLPFQILSYEELQLKYPQAKLLDFNTGYAYDYSFNPYLDYLGTDKLYYPISYVNQQFPAKTIMYIFNINNKSVAFRVKDLESDVVQKEIAHNTITIKKFGGEITVSTNDKIIPGYYELWFAWANLHRQNGIFLPLK